MPTDDLGDRPLPPRTRFLVEAGSRPALARHVRLQFDDVRNRSILQAPERVLSLSDTAVAVLKLCDGSRSVEAIAVTLAEEYDAAPADILADILPVLQDLADKGYLRP